MSLLEQATINNGYNCKHCAWRLESLDDVPTHFCFRGKEVYMDHNQILLTTAVAEVDEFNSSPNPILENIAFEANDDDEGPEKDAQKHQAVWTEETTLALLSLYEANKDITDNPKKQGKLWKVISKGLLQSFGITMTNNQVRWKINALLKRYKECIDNASQSGRGVMHFDFFEQMEEIFGYQKKAMADYTISSSFSRTKGEATGKRSLLAEKAATQTKVKSSKSDENKLTSNSMLGEVNLNNTTSDCTSSAPARKSLTRISSTSTSQSSPPMANDNSCAVKPKVTGKRNRPLNRTGSKIAKAKIELEKQWIQHLEYKETRDAMKDARHAKLTERKNEARKKRFLMKEKELRIKKEIADNKLKNKAQRHSEILEIERLKCKLLHKFMKHDSNKELQDTSDSDN